MVGGAGYKVFWQGAGPMGLRRRSYLRDRPIDLETIRARERKMTRILHITFGYVRYTILCLLGSMLVFFLTGLAMAQPKIFAGLVVSSIAAVLIIRMEMNTNRRAKESHKLWKDRGEDSSFNVGGLKEAITAAFGLATVLAPEETYAKADLVPDAIWICELPLGSLGISKKVSTTEDIREITTRTMTTLIDELHFPIHDFIFASLRPSSELIEDARKNPDLTPWTRRVSRQKPQFFQFGDDKDQQTISFCFSSAVVNLSPERFKKLSESHQVLRLYIFDQSADDAPNALPKLKSINRQEPPRSKT